ncbi:salivary glue protein Sgs-3-like [Dreissena polymorpha]|uniref:salivary glue protein Sgs-3-like n=1 Tax=Dreissena polymorpha TaxID=45954 RepID=UPI0022649D61|nr:salivary glue protein Sgs-3-like [Dreissena polymorpha]
MQTISGDAGCYGFGQVACRDASGACSVRLSFVWNGTPCGTGQMCFKGRCVPNFEICTSVTTAAPTTAAPTTAAPTTAAPTTAAPTTAAPTTAAPTTAAPTTAAPTTAAPTTDAPTTDAPTTAAPTTAAPTTAAPTTAAPTTAAPTTAAPTTAAPTTDAPTTDAPTTDFPCSCCRRRNRYSLSCCIRNRVFRRRNCRCCPFTYRFGERPSSEFGENSNSLDDDDDQSYN